MAGHLPIEVEQFILKYIDSLEEMEILLLLSSAPEKTWSPDTVYEAIRSSLDSVKQRLEALSAKGLLQAKGNGHRSYQFQPATADLASAVQSLAMAYKERRLRVLECLFSKPLSSLRIFADAFKIRKDSNNG